MAGKKTKGGRPKAPEPIKSLVSLKGSEAFERWLDELVEHARQGTRALLTKNALADFAERHGFTKPQPKR